LSWEVFFGQACLEEAVLSVVQSKALTVAVIGACDG
jgi:hypothetical protein